MCVLVLVLGAALALWADAPQAGAGKRVAAGREFQLRVGQSARLADGRLRVRFASVEEDSRCPVGVDCVWAGNARIRVVLQPAGGRAATLELNTGAEPRAASAAGYEISLKNLTPHPRAGAKIERRRYAATLVVSRK